MTPIRTAEIVAVGSELLTPHRSDTNSLWLTGRLNELGIDVRLKSIVGDDAADLESVLRLALARAELIITTGGLGPTVDDLTRDVAARVTGRTLELNEGVLEKIRSRFARRGLPMPETNVRQAMVPSGAALLPNPVGTAPGLWIETGERVLLLLPGPPRELCPLFDAHVQPRLAERNGEQRLRRRVLRLTGLTESAADERAQPVYSGFLSETTPIQTTILATPGQIELHLTAAGARPEALDAALDSGVRRLADALRDHLISEDGRTLEQVVGELLEARALRIAVAESCTGGIALGRLTDVPGSSAWVIGGIVAYDNAVKIAELGVSPALIEAHGAVSEPVGQAMAAGVRERLGADVGVAITGIAGPSGGTPAKPVGTVVIALDGPGRVVRTFAFAGDRTMVRVQSVAAALNMVRLSLTSS